MALTFTNDSASISTAEYSIIGKTTSGIPVANTGNGVYQFILDLSNMAAADQYRFKLYEKYDAAGTARLVEEWIFTNVQSKPLFISPSFILGAGFDFTGLRLSGADRTILWSIRKVT